MTRHLGIGRWAHILPIEDTREHEISADCWCDPRTDDGCVIHNADDNRHQFETGERAKS